MQLGSFFEKVSKRLSMGDILTGLVAPSVFINLLSLVFPLTLLQIYDRIIPNASLDTMTFLLIGVVIAVLFEGILRILRARIGGWAEARYEHITSCNMYHHVLNSQLSHYEIQGTGVHLERINAVNAQKDFYTGQAFASLIDLPFILLYLFVIWYLAGPVVIVPIAVLCFFTATAMHFGAFLKETIAKRRAHDERRLNFIVDILQGIHTIKSLAMEALTQRRYERLVESSADYDQELAHNSGNTVIFSSIATQATMILVVAFGSMRVINGLLTVGGLAACTFLASRTLQPVTRAIGVWSRLQTIKISEQKMEDMNALPSELHEKQVPLNEFMGRITLTDITIPHVAREGNFFNHLNLDIKSGEMIGLTGPSLSGKSSLLWLMMGVASPLEGMVLLDDKPIADFTPSSVRKHMAYIPQNGIIFAGTVLDNLTLFRNAQYGERAKALCQKLKIADMILRLPKGYANEIGQNAVDYLPRGFKQRLCIARALVDEPKVVLFDEANINIDIVADEAVRNVLLGIKGKNTQIIISQRPSLLELCDRVVCLKNGEIHDININE